MAKIHDIAHPNNRINEIPGSSESNVVWIRHPTRNPTTIIRNTTKTLRIRSATVRPTRTAGVHIGNAWNRSISPLFRSVARPIAVASEPNTTTCRKIPGIRKSTYGMRPVLIDPPKTNRNINTKMIGWIVENTSSCGTRRYWSRFRLITAPVSRRRPHRDPAIGDVVLRSRPRPHS